MGIKVVEADHVVEAEPRKLRVEGWESTENEREIHFFIKGTQTYVAGFNPKLITSQQMAAILREAGFEL